MAKREGKWVGVGVGLGLAGGSVLGAIVDNLAMWMALGVVFGLLVDGAIAKRSSRK